MNNHSEKPYMGKRDPRKDTIKPEHIKHSHCPVCGEAPCACDTIVDKALDRAPTKMTGPRITCEDIDTAIALAKNVQFHRFPHTTVTVCCVTLSNGFHVVGKSAAVSEENFDYEIGCRVALEDVQNKLWELLGLLLKQASFEGK